MPRPLWYVLLAFAFMQPAFPAPAASFGARSARLSDCRLDDVPMVARCGTFEVAENPALPSGRRLGIAVAVLPAQKGPARRDPIVFLSGGPGQAAIDSAAGTGVGLAQLFPDRDVLLIDQRGTGRSAALTCAFDDVADRPATLQHFLPPAAIARCREQLAAKADLTQYSFLRFADDIEHVRRALGYERLNLDGLSYGTRAAQVYLRAYPDAVRTVYLGSVVPIDVAFPLPFARAAERVLDATVDACLQQTACAAAFPALREETRRVFAQLAAGSVRVALPGVAEPVPLSVQRVAESVRTMTYSPDAATDVPLLLHRASLDDWTPLLAAIDATVHDFSGRFAAGVFFSITCAEDVRYIGEADIATAGTAGTRLGDFRVREQQAACKDWPLAELPRGYRAPLRSSVPMLLVSGDLDPATPAAMADHLAEGLANRVHLVTPGLGHTGWPACAERAYRRLVQTGSVRGIDATCAPTPRPPFRTAP